MGNGKTFYPLLKTVFKVAPELCGYMPPQASPLQNNASLKAGFVVLLYVVPVAPCPQERPPTPSVVVLTLSNETQVRSGSPNLHTLP